MMDAPKPRPFYIKFEQDHNGQTWAIEQVAGQRDSTSAPYGGTITVTPTLANTRRITGSREQMRWLADELARMLDGSPV